MRSLSFCDVNHACPQTLIRTTSTVTQAQSLVTGKLFLNDYSPELDPAAVA